MIEPVTSHPSSWQGKQTAADMSCCSFKFVSYSQNYWGLALDVFIVTDCLYCYIHVTVHRNRFIFKNLPDALIIQIYSVKKNSTCFGHPLCSSSGVLYCKFGTDKFHAGFLWPFPSRVRMDTWKRSSKAVPLQAWSGPEGSRKLRFPDVMTTARDGGMIVSLTHRPPLPSRKYTWYSFLLETESTPGS